MFNKFKFCLLIVLLCSLFISQNNNESFNLNVKLFGGGVISTQDFEFNTTFTPNEDVVYFTKSTSNFALMSIVSSKKSKNGSWEQPKLASFSGQFRDADPFISPNGEKLFFMSNRPLMPEDKPDGSSNLWYVNRMNNDWSFPKPVDFPRNDFASLFCPSISSNGNLYFSALDKETKKVRFYVSQNKDGKYIKPTVISFSKDGDLDPIISADESFLVFASKSRKGKGDTDLYISFNKNGVWSEPKELPYPINTAFSEGQPGISSDNTYLYFNSNRTNLYNAQYWDFTRKKKLDNYTEVQNELRSIDNGRGNIYYVSIKEILRKYRQQ